MKDLLLDDTADIEITGNDLVIGESDLQHQEHLVIFPKGSVKESPDAGIDLVGHLLGDEIDELLRETRHQFEKDGMEVRAVGFNEETNELTYDANYKG
jgi:hypothetical protein